MFEKSRSAVLFLIEKHVNPGMELTVVFCYVAVQPTSKGFRMSPVSSASAPASLSMERSSDEAHAINMARYHREYAEFERSPYRTNCANIAQAAACAGCLGCCVIAPVLTIVGEWTLPGYLSGLLCCIGAQYCSNEAQEPSMPAHPDSPRETNGWG